MKNLNLSEGQRDHALIVAPKGGRAAEVAAYTTSSGDLLISNANIRPFSPIDGTHLQQINSNVSKLNASYIENRMVKIGRCESCDNDVIATASLADVIESANTTIHCPLCSSEMSPRINNTQLIAALASQDEDFEDEGEEPSDDESEDYDNDGDDDSSAEGDEDEDYAGDEDDEPSEDEEPSDDESEGDEDYSDDEEPSDDESEGDEDYSDDDSEEPSEDDEPSEEDPSDDEHHEDEEMAFAVASLREKIKALGMDEDDDSDNAEVVDDDEDGDEDAIPEDGDEDEEPSDDDEDDSSDDVYDDDEEEAAVAAFKKVVAHMSGQRPIAGKGVDRPDIDMMNERARDTVKNRRGNKVDGNSYMKGANAVAAEDGQEMTPGTNEVPGEMTKQAMTPGTNEKVPGEMNKQSKTPGTEVSGDLTLDWNKAKIELITASDKNTIWVFADNRPVGSLTKEKASSGVQSRWNEIAGLQNAFVSVAKRGLTTAEASEFGFAAETFKVEGDKVIRNALQRQAVLATENAKAEIKRNVDRYKQSVKSAMIAAFKGIYNDLNNPVRDQLVTSLSAISVAEPRSIVDTAFAKASDNLLIAVFNKAEEWAGKSDDARNEIANHVATANYSARINEGNALAAKLASNNNKLVEARLNNGPSEKEVATGEDYSAKLRLALRSL